ncbi:extracellular solute-binding protein [Paenibacillus sp. ACRSA]|uniref:ABC transporter substrate-binding protein n=1 Tax=Paenibacillus sp. ACRSA TaxID=2918211 RepID=UPI001EF4C59E|nr:extracellular solute-binding protein [Paenibacillus sp. ACRSA]MCG7379212.1 extracellular solute-binding protein [Paenibacillus sp. ACRSA]
MKYTPTGDLDWNVKGYIDLIKTESPDILFFPSEAYMELQNENMLKDLNIFSTDEDFTAGINEYVLTTLNEMGGGSIYAYPQSMVSQALFYNKDVFSKYGIPEPADRMTWRELLLLTQRFSGDPDLQGLYTPYYDYADLLIEMGKADNRRWYDASQQEAHVGTEFWKDLITNAVTAYSSGGISIEGGIPIDLFSQGKVAMILETPYFMKQVQSVNPKINWGVVTEPVGTENPDVSTTITYPIMSGISNNAQDLATATEVWKQLNNKRTTEMRSNSSMDKFTTPIRQLKPGTEQDVFYTLKPSVSTLMERVPLHIELKQKTDRIINDGIQDAIKNLDSLHSIIDKMQEDLTHVLYTEAKK